jgi:ribosomal protein S18 acetylase RimI-like enzyme
MKINCNDNINFTSKAHPIAPFKFKSPKGVITVKEETLDCLRPNADLTEFGRFFVDNFMGNLKGMRVGKFDNFFSPKVYKKSIKNYTESCEDVFAREENLSTMLAARNSKGKLVGALLTHPFDENPLISDKKTFYIDSIAISKKYRRLGLGKKLIEKAIEADGRDFTDIYLTALKNSVKFYKKMGFSEILPTTDANKKILDIISMYRNDYPKYMTPMTKTLKPNSLRWIDRVIYYVLK